MKWTFINVSLDTREKLRALKKPGETYDTVISRLLTLTGVEGKSAPEKPAPVHLSIPTSPSTPTNSPGGS